VSDGLTLGFVRRLWPGMSRRAGVSLIEGHCNPSRQLTRTRAASVSACFFSDDRMPALRYLLTFRPEQTFDCGCSNNRRLFCLLFLFGFDCYLAAVAASSASRPAIVSAHLHRREREGKSIMRREHFYPYVGADCN